MNLTGIAPLHPFLPHVVVYTQPGCHMCNRLHRRLNNSGVPHLFVDLADPTHAEALEIITSKMGIKSTPLTVVHNVWDNSVFFTGIAPDQTRLLIKRFPLSLDELSSDPSGTPVTVDDYLPGGHLDTSSGDLVTWSAAAGAAFPHKAALDDDPGRETPWKLNSDGTVDR